MTRHGRFGASMQVTSKSIGGAGWGDRLAIVASFVCLAHCLALPLILAALPALAALLRFGDDAHVWLVAFAIPVSLTTLGTGLVRKRSVLPLLLGTTGLSLMLSGLLVPEAETPLTVAGSTLVVLAHLLNWSNRD